MGEARVDARPAINQALKNGERCTISFMATYRVALRHSEEGYSVSCPGLPGCWSQGATEDEALANIKVAIREYVEAAEELARDDESRVVEVAVAGATDSFHLLSNQISWMIELIVRLPHSNSSDATFIQKCQLTSFTFDLFDLIVVSCGLFLSANGFSPAEVICVQTTRDQPSESRSSAGKSRLPHSPPRRTHCYDGRNADPYNSAP